MSALHPPPSPTRLEVDEMEDTIPNRILLVNCSLDIVTQALDSARCTGSDDEVGLLIDRQQEIIEILGKVAVLPMNPPNKKNKLVA
jgi:hypothetical protein